MYLIYVYSLFVTIVGCTMSCVRQVAVGQFSDPDSLPGLAHFLEHMLFMGTEKYPVYLLY